MIIKININKKHIYIKAEGYDGIGQPNLGEVFDYIMASRIPEVTFSNLLTRIQPCDIIDSYASGAYSMGSMGYKEDDEKPKLSFDYEVFIYPYCLEWEKSNTRKIVPPVLEFTYNDKARLVSEAYINLEEGYVTGLDFSDDFKYKKFLIDKMEDKEFVCSLQ